MRIAFAVLPLLALSTPALAAQFDDRAAVARAKPQELIVDGSLPAAAVSAMLTPVDAFYGSWNNGSQTLLDQAISRTSSITRCHLVGHRDLAGRPLRAGRSWLPYPT